MAQFRERQSGRIVHAERVKSPMQVETYTSGWVTAGVGTWHVIDPTPGRKGAVVEDPNFRREFEPLDADAIKALDMGAPGTAKVEPGHTPAPPAHTAAQSLPPTKSAEQAALEGLGK